MIAEEYAKGMLARNQRLHPKWHYENGCLLLGMSAMYEHTGEQVYLDYVREQMDVFINEKGQIATYKIEDYNLDQINQGKLLYWLYDKTGEVRYTLAIYQLHQQLVQHPKTADGVFFHKKMYPGQVWLDGLYMASPFLAEYIRRFAFTKNYDEVIRQFVNTYRHTLDIRTGLLRHAWDETASQSWANPITGQSPHTWGRAMGWYLMALVDVLEIIPEEVPGRKFLLEILEALAPAVLRARDPETGCWFQVMECGGREGNYPEASGSIMLIAAMAKAAALGYLPAEYLREMEGTFRKFVERFVKKNSDGYLDIIDICGCAGLGSDPYRTGNYDYYISEPRSVNDYKCTGAFLQAGILFSELI